jgi:hypothetical protein
MPLISQPTSQIIFVVAGILQTKCGSTGINLSTVYIIAAHPPEHGRII